MSQHPIYQIKIRIPFTSRFYTAEEPILFDRKGQCYYPFDAMTPQRKMVDAYLLLYFFIQILGFVDYSGFLSYVFLTAFLFLNLYLGDNFVTSTPVKWTVYIFHDKIAIKYYGLIPIMLFEAAWIHFYGQNLLERIILNVSLLIKG